MIMFDLVLGGWRAAIGSEIQDEIHDGTFLVPRSLVATLMSYISSLSIFCYRKCRNKMDGAWGSDIHDTQRVGNDRDSSTALRLNNRVTMFT